MANETIVDIYCHIFPDKFFQEMSRIAPRLAFRNLPGQPLKALIQGFPKTTPR